MTLAPLPGGSQRFTPPAVNTIPDILGLTRPPVMASSVRPVGPARYTVTPLGKEFAGAYYWRVELYDARGGLRQEGRFDEDHARASITDLVCDDQGILRLPFDTVTVTTTPTPTSPFRATRANFLGREIFGMGDGGTQKLYAETSPIVSTPGDIAGYVTASGTHYSMEAITVNAVPYLAIGGSTAFEVLSSLSPVVQTTLGGANSPVWGIVQTPIDNDSILFMAGTPAASIYAFATNVGIGAVALETRQTGFPAGGYCAGLVSLGGGATQVLWVVPRNGNFMVFGNSPTDATRDYEGKAVLTDMRGWSPNELKFPLKFVAFATVVAGSQVFACDLESHYFHTGRSVIAVDKASDWPANSDKRRVCRGHHVKGDKVIWEVNEIANSGVTANTRRWWMEYDINLNTSRQISAAETLGAAGLQSVGGPNLPFSLTNDTTTIYAKTGSWKQQYVPPSNMLGYAARKTAGATAGTGHLYAASATMTWGPQEIPGLEGAQKIVARITGPAQESLLAGGAGTRLVVTAGGKTATFDTQVPSQTHPYTDFENNGNWFQRLTVSLAASRSTTATDAQRLTGNYYPLVIEGFAVKRPLRLPANWRGALT